MAFINIDSYDKYVEKANERLGDYYARLLSEEQGDVERAKRRLMEDYNRGFRINNEDYKRSIDFGQESASASKQELALDSESEQRKLESSLLQRGVSQGGLAETEKGRLKTRQDLRREAIDRALRKSEEDLKFGKERGLEEETIKQKRGTEDVATQFAKFQTEKQQERQEKSQQLGEADYQRAFSKAATEKGFDFQKESLDKMG